MKRDRLGQRKIKAIKISDAKLWLIQLQNNGLGYSSTQNVRGLIIQDIDMEKRIIHVYRQLQRLPDMQYMITETKISSGARNLPMTPGVYETFQRILKNRKRPKVEPMVDKQIGFLFLDKNGMPKVANHWQDYLHRMVGKYNRTHKIQMINIIPHVCRHTYCTNMARMGINPKSLQYLMGHAEIATTMTHE